MEALSLGCVPIEPSRHRPSSWRRNLVYCQERGKVVKSSGLSSTLTERSTLVTSDNGKVLIDPGSSLVLSPNGKNQAEIHVKDLVPYREQTTSFVGMDDGIGIVRFLRGKSFFITGATGFLAKVLTEKILRTVPDVGKLYLLIQARDKEAAMQRLISEITSLELFKHLQQTYGKSYEAFMMSKLVPVPGDICEPNLGLGGDMADFIAKDVDIIVNSAANTTFDERYDVAIDINTKGPLHLMNFAKRCKKLKLFTQVSTAYVNGQRHGKILEKPFRIGDSIVRENLSAEIPARSFPKLDVESEIRLASNAQIAKEDQVLNQKTKELGFQRAKNFGWQDTYVFTKAMGEMLIDHTRGEIPVVIIRPSIIESTYKEPFPGWVEGNRMMDPIVLYYGKGQITGFPVDPCGVIDVVPADMVVNATLASIARHGMAGKPGISVYQIASSVVNPLVIQELAKFIHEHYSTSPCMDSKGKPIPVSMMKLFSSVEEFSDHLHRSASTINGLATRPSSNEKLSQRVELIRKKLEEQTMYLANIYEPYTFYRGRFDNSNTQRLLESMSDEEKRKFGFDVGSIDWKDFITNVHIPGLRRHVMKGRGMSS